MCKRKKGCAEVRFCCEAWSVKCCDIAGLNYVSCSPFRVPIALFAAAQADVKEALQEIYRLGKSCQLWLTKLWVTKSLYHCIFVLFFAQCAVKQAFSGDTNAIQLIFAMWYKNFEYTKSWYKIITDIICIGIVSSLYQRIFPLLLRSYIFFSLFDTKIQTKWAKYNKACFDVLLRMLNIFAVRQRYKRLVRK